MYLVIVYYEFCIGFSYTGYKYIETEKLVHSESLIQTPGEYNHCSSNSAYFVFINKFLARCSDGG